MTFICSWLQISHFKHTECMKLPCWGTAWDSHGTKAQLIAYVCKPRRWFIVFNFVELKKHWKVTEKHQKYLSTPVKLQKWFSFLHMQDSIKSLLSYVVSYYLRHFDEVSFLLLLLSFLSYCNTFLDSYLWPLLILSPSLYPDISLSHVYSELLATPKQTQDKKHTLLNECILSSHFPLVLHHTAAILSKFIFITSVAIKWKMMNVFVLKHWRWNIHD